MQIVMLVLVESIRRTLCTGSLKLQSVLVSEAARVWIITSSALTVRTRGERTSSLLFYCLILSLALSFPFLSLWGVILQSTVLFYSFFYSVSSVFCLSKFIRSYFSFSPPFLVSFYILFSFSHILSVYPHALRSTTQQPLNYSHQTTLCIFFAVPL